jgi:hypothetical protein
VFSEACEMLDQKTAMLDKKCALKFASAPPEKLAILTSQMDQLRMSLSGTPTGADSPRGADVWRAASDAVLSRTRSSSSGGGSGMFLGGGGDSALSTPSGGGGGGGGGGELESDHELRQQFEKIEDRMNSLEESAWDEKHGASTI